jgi:hypothetical protein
MALVIKDRVKQTTTTTGTGTLTLNGTVDGFQTFAAALSDGDTTYYSILEPSTNELGSRARNVDRRFITPSSYYRTSKF